MRQKLYIIVAVLLICLISGCTPKTVLDTQKPSDDGSIEASTQKKSDDRQQGDDVADKKGVNDTGDTISDANAQDTSDKATDGDKTDSDINSAQDGGDTDKADITEAPEDSSGDDREDNTKQGTDTDSDRKTDEGDDEDSRQEKGDGDGPEQKESEDDGRSFCWEVTYITWLPKFEAGSYEGHHAADTFDYATFSGVSRKEYRAYIEALTERGFSKNITENKQEGETVYSAQNETDWYAELKYDGDRLILGSGFIDEEEEKGDSKREYLWSATMLAYLPEYSGGELESIEEGSSSDQYNYATFSGVEESEVREYIQTLKSLGYIYDVEEGDTDGVIWYMALSQDRLGCYLSYDDNIMRIGCGYSEDE